MTPKICLTASTCLIHQGKVLVIRHKKLKTLLCPGGHVDENELPHKAAEREMLEESGLKVEVISAYDQLSDYDADSDVFHPLPFAINEHWICKENYDKRLAASQNNQKFKPEELWSKGCEKHLNFNYLAKLVGPLEINPARYESREVYFLSKEEVEGKYRSEFYDAIFAEIIKAFELAKKMGS